MLVFSPPPIHVKVLTPIKAEFGDGASKEVNSIK